MRGLSNPYARYTLQKGMINDGACGAYRSFLPLIVGAFGQVGILSSYLRCDRASSYFASQSVLFNAVDEIIHSASNL